MSRALDGLAAELIALVSAGTLVIMRRIRCATLLVFMLVVSSAAGEAQQALSCAGCRVDLTFSRAIPSDLQRTALAVTPAIAYSQDRYILGPTIDGVIATWSESATWVIGRRGHGPNEFPESHAPVFAVTPKGTVAVAHGARLSMVSVDHRSVVRQTRLPFAPVALDFVGSQLVAASSSAEVALLNDDGTVLARIRTPRTLRRNDVPVLAPSGDTAFWIGSNSEYRLELVGLDGRVRHSVSRTPEWFRPVRGNPRGAPTPQLYGAYVYRPGVLLVALLVPDPKWRPEYGRSMPLTQARTLPRYDTVLEFVEISTNRVLATARYDEFLRRVKGNGQFYTEAESPSGDIVIRLVDVHLRQ